MNNNVISFPPTWDEYDVNNDGKSGGGSDPIVENAKQTGGFGYTESGEQILFDGIAELEETDFDYYIGFLEMDGTLTVGSVCNVDFDGEEYQLTVHEVSAHGTNANVIGNDVFIGGEDNGVPFLIMDSGTMGGMTSSVGGSKNLKVAQAAAVIHKIDEKYLPASGGAMVVTLETTDGATATANKSIDELFTASATSLVIAQVMIGGALFGAFPLYMSLSPHGEPMLGFGAPAVKSDGGFDFSHSLVCGVCIDGEDIWSLNLRQ